MSVTDILSIQLYTLRSLEDLDRMLDIVAGAGYRYVETVGSHLDKAAEVRAKLDARGLRPPRSHVSLAALREKPDAVVDALQDARLHRISTCRRFRPERARHGRGRLALARRASSAGWRERFQATGNPPRLPQPSLGAEAEGWRKTALELIFEAAGASPPRLAGRRRLAGARRRRSEGMDRPLPQQAHRRPRQGHRARRPERG